MPISVDRLKRGVSGVLAAGGLFTSAFVAPPEAVQSKNDKPRLTVATSCIDDNDHLYHPYFYPRIKGTSAVYVSYADPVHIKGEERILVASGEGYIKYTSQSFKSDENLPTRFEKFLVVDLPANSDAALRVMVTDWEGRPSAEVSIKPLDCSGS
jgi:hypothetical protein